MSRRQDALDDLHARIFRAAWKAGEWDGVTDALDGKEYARVYEEWVRAGYPRDVFAFIRSRANAPPTPPAAGENARDGE